LTVTNKVACLRIPLIVSAKEQKEKSIMRKGDTNVPIPTSARSEQKLSLMPRFSARRESSQTNRAVLQPFLQTGVAGIIDQ
jgi:hypothetical protein